MYLFTLLFYLFTTNAGSFQSHGAPYMPTGFYYVTDGSTGVKMILKGTKEVYSIAPVAFASVKNIAVTRIIKTPADRGTYTDLRLIFDAKGIADLREGTGNPMHPLMAVVLAGKLIYVVDNVSKITTGVMNVGLVNYSDKEIIDLKNEIDHKR
jgi:hypothetical protein